MALSYQEVQARIPVPQPLDRLELTLRHTAGLLEELEHLNLNDRELEEEMRGRLLELAAKHEIEVPHPSKRYRPLKSVTEALELVFNLQAELFLERRLRAERRARRLHRAAIRGWDQKAETDLECALRNGYDAEHFLRLCEDLARESWLLAELRANREAELK